MRVLAGVGLGMAELLLLLELLRHGKLGRVVLKGSQHFFGGGSVIIRNRVAAEGFRRAAVGQWISGLNSTE